MPPVAAVDPEKILKDLRDLWVELGKDQEASGGVLRACAMTLLVAAEPDPDGRDAEAAHRTIGVLMHDHPSRAIVISPREGGELAARVFSECWMPFGSQQQICADGIEITSDPEQTGDAARLLVPLIAPDLPVVLWCRGAHAFRDRSLDPLFPLADKIIFDTAQVRHAPSAIEFLRRMRKSGQLVADLEWTRLTAWREAIAHLFEQGTSGGAVARVLYSGEKPATGLTYFTRWLEGALPGASLSLEPASGGAASGPAGLCAVTFPRAGRELSIRLRDAAALEVRDGERVYTSPLPGASEEWVMREELSILGPDPVFDSVLL